MKRILAFVLAFCLALPSLSVCADITEMRAVWFSYEDFSSQLSNLGEKEYIEKAESICENLAKNGFNTLIFHVRAFSDAFYNSSYFGYSKYVCGTPGVSPGYDPLRLMCQAARKSGISLHAWINPYRIGSPSNVTESSVAYAWKSQYGNERVCDVNGLWYYNPASKEVRDYIVEGVRELVEGYDIDGIHFDDYFYPTSDISFDNASYIASGTALPLEKWRIENINLLIKQTYDNIKEINPNAVFGVSPNANIEKDYSDYYADVRLWATEKGYVDYIAPQIYFGYKNSAMPFIKVLNQWSNLCTAADLYIGLAPYKAGKEDKWAGDGKYEWIESANICARQISDIRAFSNVKGFMLFCYSPLFGPNASESAKVELKNIRSVVIPVIYKSSATEHFINMLKAFFKI